ncbi:Hypothetical_protein [Hexamita inflata]|uniref:Hypothetical_protein n=1 Tax=Hexamita inflata TaxID=28002 RepID=A0AA86UIT1_9EUKA|nr:Hypothetical protein HINF_LOCUS45044 [Hexamita inflata]
MLTIFISQLNTPLYSCLVRLAWRRKYIQKYSRDQTVCRCRVLLQTSKPQHGPTQVQWLLIERQPASGMLHHFAATPPFTQQLGPNTIVDLETHPGYRHGKRQINSWRMPCSQTSCRLVQNNGAVYKLRPLRRPIILFSPFRQI